MRWSVDLPVPGTVTTVTTSSFLLPLASRDVYKAAYFAKGIELHAVGRQSNLCLSPDARGICMLVASESLSRVCQLTFATKTDDDTERQLVHTLAHAIVFIVSICCL